MLVDAEQLKSALLDANLITEEQFESAQKEAEKTGQNAGDILVSKGIINQERLAKIQAYALGVPFINLENAPIPIEILKIIPEQIARAHNIVAFRQKDSQLEVAMLDPDDLRTIESIKKTMPGLKIAPRLTTKEGIKNALRQYRESLEAEFSGIIKKTVKEEKEIKELARGWGEKSAEQDPQKTAEDLPVIKIVDALMSHAILQRASDVHIEPLEQEVVIRYRVDGILHDAMLLPVGIAPGIAARIKVLSNLKLDEHRLPQDGRFKIETDEYKYSVRVSILPVYNGEKIVMRLLEENSKTRTLEGLGLSGRDLELVKNCIQMSSGMILVTGPTGSGKTSSLYAMMEILNTADVNISTVEDPIEYRMPRINQTQVNPKVGLTFASGLRSLVRQDPDIIMVGEIRDNETASLAINAALTGHLVLSTLHTTEAAGAIPRMIDMKCEPFLISSTLEIIIAQRLVRRLDDNKEKYRLKEPEIKNITKYSDEARLSEILKKEGIIKENQRIKDVDFYKPCSSKENPDGYKSRIAIFEVLPVTETIKNLTERRSATKDIHSQAIKEGMRTMFEDGIIKAAKGVTSIEEVLRATTE